MASENKKRKGINSYMAHLGHKNDLKMKRIAFYTKQDRKAIKNEIYNSEG